MAGKLFLCLYATGRVQGDMKVRGVAYELRALSCESRAVSCELWACLRYRYGELSCKLAEKNLLPLFSLNFII